MAKRRTREEWAKLVAMFERAGQSVDQFCRRRGIRPETFQWWRWRLRGTAPASPASPVQLLAVDVTSPAGEDPGSSAPAIGISLPGLELRIGLGTDVDYVAALVAALRARC